HIQKNAPLCKTDEVLQDRVTQSASSFNGPAWDDFKSQDHRQQTHTQRRSARMGRQMRGFACIGLLSLLVLMGFHQGSSAPAFTCGSPRPVPRISGGLSARRGEWPWQVSVQYRDSHICGGSLISDLWIVTAAHCFSEIDDYRLSKWSVVLGRLKLKGRQVQGLERNVTEIILHPDYTDFKKGKDIALVRLSKPVSFSNDILPICLPFTDHRFAFGTQCWISGWGDISSNASLPDPMPLQEMSVDLLTADTCNCIYSNLRDRKTVHPALPGMICALTPDSKRGPCKGDSGGPLVCLENGRWFQAGLMSFSMGCGRFIGPIILTEIQAYTEWIQEHVEGATFAKQTEPRPNTTDNYMCIGCGKLKPDTPGAGAEGPWPWYVSLRHEGQHVCGGSLVAEDWIVTAAQCFIGKQDTEGWEVLLGEQQVGMDQKWQEKRTLRKIVLHGAYVDMKEGYDIAMALLSHPVVFNDSIRAICAPYSTHQFPFGSTCWTRGWSLYPDSLHMRNSSSGGVEVKLLGPQNCNCIYNKTSKPGNEISITSDMLCATPYESTMHCEEGIGEPLICNERGKWFLAGISSFGKGCGTVVHPGVYTRVSAYQNWMMELAWTTYYDMQQPPLPIVQDEDTCLNELPQEAGHD
ncbi:LOW QUALITY PROTEIN: serine protease 53, partial [Tiliqua scincoides]|uniref:LOW QUALITY PROTEIN: serine protease 53 n=1 Tax=Tiliqua scincoides TaxID=71010 RepID=UPI0034627AF7